MDLLKSSALAFLKLTDSDYVITAQKGNHTINVSIFFDPGQFAHLIGLSKLRDLPVLSSQSNKNIFQNILNDEITYETISKSVFINSISDRIHYFPELEEVLNNKIILRFNRNKAHSLINATMLLYRKQDEVYLHLFLAPKENGADILIPCSFFPRNDNKYIIHQDIYKVIQIQKTDRRRGLSERIQQAKLESENTKNPSGGSPTRDDR